MREKLKLNSRPMVVQVVAERRWTILGLYATSVLSTETPCSYISIITTALLLAAVTYCSQIGAVRADNRSRPCRIVHWPICKRRHPRTVLVGSIIIVRRRAGVGFAAKRRKLSSAPALSDRRPFESVRSAGSPSSTGVNLCQMQRVRLSPRSGYLRTIKPATPSIIHQSCCS